MVAKKSITTSPHHHTTTSTHQHHHSTITTSPSPHHHITASPQPTTPHDNITTWPHHHITTTSPHHHITASPHHFHHLHHVHLFAGLVDAALLWFARLWLQLAVQLLRPADVAGEESNETLCFLAQSGFRRRCGEPCGFRGRCSLRSFAFACAPTRPTL